MEGAYNNIIMWDKVTNVGTDYLFRLGTVHMAPCRFLVVVVGAGGVIMSIYTACIH